MSAKLDRAPTAKFQSGQYVDGLFEFDSSEVFILEDGTREQLVGRVPLNAVIRIQRQGGLGLSRFQVVGKRVEGQRMILLCDRLPSSADCFHFVRYQGEAQLPAGNFGMVDQILGVEAIETHPHGTSHLAYLVRIYGVPQWVPATSCLAAEDPYLRIAG